MMNQRQAWRYIARVFDEGKSKFGICYEIESLFSRYRYRQISNNVYDAMMEKIRNYKNNTKSDDIYIFPVRWDDGLFEMEQVYLFDIFRADICRRFANNKPNKYDYI